MTRDLSHLLRLKFQRAVNDGSDAGNALLQLHNYDITSPINQSHKRHYVKDHKIVLFTK